MKLIANTILLCAAAIAILSLQWGKTGTLTGLALSIIGLSFASSALFYGWRRQA